MKFIGLLLISCALLLGHGRAAYADQDKPFATHHLVLQISDADLGKQALILSISNSLLKDYGPDNIAIEVVAFGPGVHLLYADNPNRVGVESLIAQGVRFDVCMNTINTIVRDTGHAPALDPHIFKVDYGVGQILKLVGEGYVLVRP
ncbi:MAG: hypothetical protein B7Z78_01675 [Rhodospirillales bacterium 20-60-12]|nr:MAG: hypothetical protein B7Z78_01675 [Rhodospirillales bacterium 20-60-12]HQT68126.1 hypothetical protein [Acetobacteraceae bacterium]HQU03009.1 hypothetical protein [Acetobacteraceae bacterium]